MINCDEAQSQSFEIIAFGINDILNHIFKNRSTLLSRANSDSALEIVNPASVFLFQYQSVLQATVNPLVNNSFFHWH